MPSQKEINALVKKLTTPKRNAHRFREQISVMQDALFRDAMAPGIDPAKRASCARAWDVLDERRRIRDGKLKPGSINARDDSQVKPKKKRKSSEISALPSPQAEPPKEQAG